MTEELQNHYNKFIIEMNNRSYSEKTIKVYSNQIYKFLNYTSTSKLSPEERISTYISTVTSNVGKTHAYSAILIFYRTVIHKKCPYTLSGRHNPKRLVSILTRNDILQILSCIKNKKHYLMIAMLYGSGLRVSEVVDLKVGSIDLESKMLKVHNGKGKKDRFTILSDLLLPDLRALISNLQASDYLFMTQSKTQYSIRTIQTIFTRALSKSGIKKNASCHTLRHSFATHFIESGINIKVLQRILGHKSIKTTMQYVHIEDTLSFKITSPL